MPQMLTMSSLVNPFWCELRQFFQNCLCLLYLLSPNHMLYYPIYSLQRLQCVSCFHDSSLLIPQVIGFQNKNCCFVLHIPCNGPIWRASAGAARGTLRSQPDPSLLYTNKQNIDFVNVCGFMGNEPEVSIFAFRAISFCLRAL